MTTYYSDNFGTQDASAVVGISAPEVGYRPSPGQAHGRLRMKKMRGNVNDQMAATERLIMGTFKSSDRIWELFHEQDDLSVAAATYDLGIYLSGTNHDGAAVDSDVFEDGASAAAAVSYADKFKGASLTDIQRGDPLWSLCGLSSDPVKSYDLVLTAMATLDLGGESNLIAFYTSGD